MRPPTSAPFRYLRIAAQLARIGVVRKSQFRVEFLSQILMDLVWYAVHVAIFEILFEHADDIAGWSREEVRVFLGFLFVADAFLMMWLGQQWHFGRDLKDGKLDPFRVRPASPLFLYYFQLFSLEAVFNMAVAFGYLAFALSRVELPLGWLTVPAVALGILAAWWARFVLTVLFSLSEFWLLHSDIGQTLERMATAAADRPLDIFSRRTQHFFLFLVPVGVMTHAPASLVLGRSGFAAAAFHASWMFALGLLVCRAWTLGFRRYESAMG